MDAERKIKTMAAVILVYECKLRDRPMVEDDLRDDDAMAALAYSSLLSTRSLKKPTSALSWKLPLSPAFNVAVWLPRHARSPPVFVVFAMDAKPTVPVAEKLGEAGLNLLKGFANVDCSYNLSPEELCTKISSCDALIVRSETKVSREVFGSSAGRLKVVGCAGVGIDNVDLAAAPEHGCLVSKDLGLMPLGLREKNTIITNSTGWIFQVVNAIRKEL
ncbi:hypothetical protein RJ640_012505, partial [Escallonia rubra]